ncbi:hypothetical protein D4764_03G0001980 [Takifugu flavidus]|uniref:Uncharacterized protein n=1 Tax=Takifugu flavidus TaxID=433684 RepID=A0A5C6NBD8_9TELE|nr:hypothetical protein D4764_03G0001980 [Takifugu flavidus]
MAPRPARPHPPPPPSPLLVAPWSCSTTGVDETSIAAGRCRSPPAPPHRRRRRQNSDPVIPEALSSSRMAPWSLSTLGGGSQGREDAQRPLPPPPPPPPWGRHCVHHRNKQT